MDAAVGQPASPDDAPRGRPRSVKDFYTSKIRLAVVLLFCFAVLPGALLITVGILVLVFGQQSKDVVFGVLTLSLALTLIAGIVFTWVYVRRATSLARLQTEFVQKVSHDLRTPLTSIRMFVETLQSGRLGQEKVQECLDVLTVETQRLQAMVERLLKWASMEAGKRLYHPEHVRPSELVDGALQALEPQLVVLPPEVKVTIDREVADHLPFVDVDYDAMVEALLNVLQNALRYTPGDKQIRVRVVRHEREVEISITDNGPGIPKAQQRAVFEKFHRYADPANAHVEGTGLGLAMVQHIVGAHAGRIDVDSDVGKGATFRISLPAVVSRVVDKH
jgi:two-component system phosphate regulon sensor histidine kinase PhoR